MTDGQLYKFMEIASYHVVSVRGSIFYSELQAPNCIVAISRLLRSSLYIKLSRNIRRYSFMLYEEQTWTIVGLWNELTRNSCMVYEEHTCTIFGLWNELIRNVIVILMRVKWKYPFFSLVQGRYFILILLVGLHEMCSKYTGYG